MGQKTAGVGQFHIPTAPAALTATAQSASANTYGSAVSFGNAPSTLFVVAVSIGVATTQTPTYVAVQILVGGSVVGEVLVPYGVSSAAANSVVTGKAMVWPPIPITSGAAITCKTASSVASAVAWGVSLECIAQSNVVDDGVAVATVTTVTNQLTAAQIATGVWQDATAGDFTAASSIGKSLYTSGNVPGAAGGHFIAGTNAATTVTTSFTTTFTGNLTGSVASVTGAVGSVTGAVGSVTGLTASNLDATISSRMASYTQPTGFLAATFPATVASPTNITTVGAVSGAVGSVTGAVGSVTGNVGGNVGGNVTGSVGSVVGLTASNLDATVSSRLATVGYTAPDNTSITSIKAKTDALTFTVAGFIDSNILKVNGITVTGSGTALSPWGP